jgi:hypothetical protein
MRLSRKEKQTMKNGKTKNSNGKNSKPAVKKSTKPAAKGKKATVKAAHPRFMVFGDMSATSVVRALGKLNWKPEAAIKAMAKMAPKLSVSAIRNSLFVGRHGKGAAPATLAKVQLAQLKKLAA